MRQHARLVVRGATAVQAPVALGGLERGRGPVGLLPRRLHVVVGVEQDRGATGRRGAARDDRGRAVGAVGPGGAQHLHVGEAGGAQQRLHLLGAGLHVRLVEGAGRDARDAHERLEVGAHPRQVLVEGGAQGVDVGHAPHATEGRAATVGVHPEPSPAPPWSDPRSGSAARAGRSLGVDGPPRAVVERGPP